MDRALNLVDADSFASRSAAVLSGGERTRVLLARALAVEAPLLLVDEPIAGLDPYHQLHVMEILKNAADEGAGVLAVLHDLTLAARFMDRLILLHQGEVVDSGTPDEVLTEENLERVYQVSAVNAVNSGGPIHPAMAAARAPGGLKPGTGGIPEAATAPELALRCSTEAARSVESGVIRGA